MKRLLSYIDKKNRIWILVSTVLIILQAILELKIPDYVSQMTLLLQTEGTTVNAIIVPGMMMLACAAVSLALCVLSGFLIARMAAALAARLRKEVFYKTLDFSLEEMGKLGTSSLITRCTQDIQIVQYFFSTGLQLLIKAPFLAGIAIVKISGQEITWTLSTVVAVVLIITIMGGIIRICAPQMAVIQRCTDELNKLGKEHVTGLRVIHAFNSYTFHRKRFDTVNTKLADISGKNGRTMALMTPGFTLVMFALNFAIYLIGIFVIDAAPTAERAMIYANMIAFSSYSLQIVQAFIFLIRAIMLIPRLAVSSRRINEVIDTVPSIQDGPGEELHEAAGTIEFKNVSFRYPGAAEYAIRNVSFRIESGQTAAFIGSTGCGKTTVMNLIPRLYDVSEGQVLVNGVDVRQYQQHDLRNRIGYVPQKSRLFTGTIAGNIAYGDNGRFNASLKEIKAAAEVGQAKEFIEQKQGGFDAEVLSGGNNFSGGQKQRLTISRAICRDPEIYLFDDSFSALDFMTDRKLRKALRETSAGATVVIVAQRIGTIRAADQIFVMDQGQIVGSGTHDELMETCAVYKEIAETQLAAQAG